MKQITFIRWGNLNPVKHREHNKPIPEDMSGFHIAPRRKGIYAFPQGYVERFLLSGEYTSHWKKECHDNEGNRIYEKQFFNENGTDDGKGKFLKFRKKRHIKSKDIVWTYDKENGGYYMCYLAKPKSFTYQGPIWHHLKDYVKDKGDILEEHNSWVKTSMRTYIDALHRCDVRERFDASRQIWGTKQGNPHTHPRACSKDHYEVFIERI